jgi:hypothetical protein
VTIALGFLSVKSQALLPAWTEKGLPWLGSSSRPNFLLSRLIGNHSSIYSLCPEAHLSG